MHWWNYTETGKTVNTGSKLYPCATLSTITSRVAWPGIEFGFPHWDASDWPPDPWQGL